MPSSQPKKADTLEEFFHKFPARSVKKGRPLLYQGEIPTMAFYINSGVIKIYNISNSGEEKIVGYETKGALLPVEWLFDRAPVSLYYYDTFTDCEVSRVSKPDIQDLLSTDHQAALDLLKRAVSMYIGATIHLHALEQSKARNKLLYILQYLVMRFGDQINQTQYRIDLRLTHQDIANLIGTTRETTSGEIGKLAKEGVVNIKDQQYIVDADKALRLLGESDFGDLRL